MGDSPLKSIAEAYKGAVDVEDVGTGSKRRRVHCRKAMLHETKQAEGVQH